VTCSYTFEAAQRLDAGPWLEGLGMWETTDAPVELTAPPLGGP
jgi:hypothetical protein